jgi:hypothetical protein
MIMRTSIVVATLLLSAAAAGAETGPFANPVKDCHPCRFSPGKGKPEFDLTFVFKGTGTDRALVAFDIAPVGGKPRRLDTGDVAVSDFPDGFILDTTDLNFDGLGDLALTTGLYAGNSAAEYWIYEPATHDFVPLERSGAGDADNDNRALVPTATRELYCHVHVSNAEHKDYWYRVTGHRAVAVREEVQAADGNLFMRTTYDLTVKPPRLRSRHAIGYSGASPARTEFLKLLDAQGRKAAAAYKAGDKKKAAQTMAFSIGTVELYFVVDSVPVQGTDPQDRKIVGEFNDYGFYLAEAGRYKDAIDVLGEVVDVDPDRLPAYLNLADAQYAAGDKAAAKANYAEYRKRMAAAGKADKVPPRVAERLR